MSRLDDAIQAKKEKRAAIEALGLEIHPYSYEKKQTIKQSLASLGKKVKTAGRVTSARPHGKVIFFDLQDQDASMQLMLRRDEVDEKEFAAAELTDPGDYVGVEGEVVKTRTDELTIQVNKFTFLGKALRPLPTAWNAAEDKDVRFRQRYIDMLINPDVKKILDTRWLVLREIRKFLQEKYHFTEVETPVLQPLYGGTNAKPFTTHMNALDHDYYLRIAPELYLKRLIVGGYERVFEIARNFRNEGIDQTHQPEFTMIEWYQAYADYQVMMDVAEELIKHLVEKVNGELKVEVGEQEVDVSGNWPRVKMVDALKQYAGIDFESLSDEELKDLLKEHEISLRGVFSRGKAMFALFDELVAPQLIGPIWIIDYPRAVSPLSKHHRENDFYAERYEAYIAGKELADGWSEIVDPIDQREIFENEQKNMRAGDDEAHPLDEDFIKAMEHGMPPLGGIGMGIDRLVMFLTNTWSIREVIAFPTLRTKDSNVEVSPQKIEVEPQAVKVKTERKDHPLPPRGQAEKLLDEYIEDENLKKHCQMVAAATAAYAEKMGEDVELWYQVGLLHDLDWEKYPDEHPVKAVNEILTDYPVALLEAIEAHAPHRTGRQPKTKLERYLFACDELSGFLNAYALMRPKNFAGMKASKVKKKLKDTSFAANVNREDIKMGFELLEEEASEHIQFLIEVFNKMELF